MKKFFAFLLISIVFMFTYRSAVRAENILSLVHSGVQYSTAQAAEPDSGYPYNVEDDGDALHITDEASGIMAEVTRQTLDDEAFEILRDYYNDSTLSNKELFSRFTELKKSYVNALETLYNTNYLSGGKKSPETAMQIYYEGREVLFGLDDSSVYLYNIARYEGLYNNEQTHLDLIIPVRSTSTVIIIKFTIPRDKLGTTASGSIAAMLTGIRFEGLSPQSKVPVVLNDKSITEAAQMGIYPAASQKQPVYKSFEDTAAGFSLSLPTTYVPFIQNNLGGIFTYTSFKINPNQIFSVSSEPLQGSGASDAISRFKVAFLGSIKVLGSGAMNLDGNNYSYLAYSSTEDYLKQYFYDYYIQDESRIYKLQLQCAIAEPSSNVNEQFKKILASFRSKNAASVDTAVQTTQSGISATTTYLNSDEGYSFTYPGNWRLEDISPDIAYDRLRLVVPGLSGALDISVQESELKQIVTFADIMKSVNGKSVTSWPTLVMNYNPPFAEKTSKLLYSDFSIDGAVSTIYRLGVFMDDNGRNRLFYSVDIIKGRKLYSMFITAGEYKTTDGQFNDTQINELINAVAASFRLESTQESESRRISGETRNRKIVFVEDYLKQLIDPGLVVAAVEKTQPDKTLFVTVVNTGESGFYKIKLDYPGRQIEVVDSVLKRDILNSELVNLMEQYKSKVITNAVQNESSMTITIESRENQISARVVRTYRVDVSFVKNNVTWQSVRLAHQEDYMREGGLYVKSLLPPGTKVYFSNDYVFKDLEPYRQKEIKYRLMTYAQSDDASGFLVLSMNPRSSLFTAEGGFIPLEHAIDNIMTKYGINYLRHSPNAFSFNPETFILTLSAADSSGKDAKVEQFKIFYNLETGMLEYKKVN